MKKLLVFVFVFVGFSLCAATNSVPTNSVPVVSGQGSEFINNLIDKFGWLSYVFWAMGFIGFVVKPVMKYLESYVVKTPEDWDNKALAAITDNKVYKVVAFVADWILRIKLPTKGSKK